MCRAFGAVGSSVDRACAPGQRELGASERGLDTRIRVPKLETAWAMESIDKRKD